MRIYEPAENFKRNLLYEFIIKISMEEQLHYILYTISVEIHLYRKVIYIKTIHFKMLQQTITYILYYDL